jgi:hypothetical protein
MVTFNFLDLAFAFVKRLRCNVRVERGCIPKRGSWGPVAILSGDVLPIPCLVGWQMLNAGALLLGTPAHFRLNVRTRVRTRVLRVL